ncbi:hypothetical protein ABS71_20365 [bacterium SCN 62-11]|nr:hypothetical protein [Candidatus Eremiobacteraeota bacterium]ODT57240.1 MAG: hypothetical protein ABS71_20365 [bacterium SCN 62-11]
MAAPLNTGFNINQQFANKLGSGQGSVAENLRNQSGVTHTAKKTTVKKGGTIAEEGSNLSPAAREALKSEQAQHADHMAEHGNEMAKQAGLDVPADDHEQSELQRKRGYDRDQTEGPSADGKSYQMASPDGTMQVIPTEKHAYLTQKMDDPDYTDAQVLDPIPEANLEAANAVMDTQLAQGVSKVAVLKTDPKIDALADQMEIVPQPPLAEPMDIRDSGNDPKMKPLQLELPPETERIAAERAAADLASGKQTQEALMADGTSSAIDNQRLESTKKDLEINDSLLESAAKGEVRAIPGLRYQKWYDSTEDMKDSVARNSLARIDSTVKKLPPEAQEGLEQYRQEARQEFLGSALNQAVYNGAAGYEKEELEKTWTAQAAQKLSETGGLDEVSKLNLSEGSRQFFAATSLPAAITPALQEAQATTAQQDGILSKLAAGPLEVGGKSIPQAEGYEAARNNAWDRMENALQQLPEKAQKSIDSRFHAIQRSVRDNPETGDDYRNAPPEQRASMESEWKAQAIAEFVDQPRKAGFGKDLDAANFQNLADGSRHFLAASQGLQEHSDSFSAPPGVKPLHQTIFAPHLSAAQPQAQYPTYPYMNSYPNYMTYPPIPYGGIPGGGWNSWGGMGTPYGMPNMNNGMDFTMKMFAVSNLISSLSFPLMMFSMF